MYQTHPTLREIEIPFPLPKRIWGIMLEGQEELMVKSLILALHSVKEPILNYLEIGVAYGGTLANMADCCSAQGLQWRAIGLDIPDGGTLDEPQTRYHCIQWLKYWERTPMGVQSLPVNAISMILYPNGRDFLPNIEKPFRIGHCLIDGCHGTPCVVKDFVAVEKYSTVGTVVVFHDSDHECQGMHFQDHCGMGIGVRRAILYLGFSDVEVGATVDRNGVLWQMLADTAPLPENHGCYVVQRVES